VLTSCFKLMSRATIIPSTRSVVLAIAVCVAQDAPRGGHSLHPKPREIDWTERVPPPAREQPPLGSEAEVKERYDLAWKLVRADDYDSALEEFAWLWQATDNKASPWEPEIWHRIIESIGRVAAFHEPTRRRFTAILDDLDAYVRSDPPQSAREWSDWAELSRAMQQDDRLIRLYEERRSPDGSLHAFSPASKEEWSWLRDGGPFPSKGGTLFHPYAMDELFDVLVETHRFADAGRLHPDLVGMATLTIEHTDAFLKEYADHFSDSEIEEMRQADREEVALLYALGLAAERTEETAEIAAALLKRYDDAMSRRALVLACHRVGVTAAAVQRWESELQASGEDLPAREDAQDLKESAAAPR
jgi:hypothetical protein